MDRIDRSVIEALKNADRVDSGVVSALGTSDFVEALVRVRDPLRLSIVERNFDVTHFYPFIRSVGIRCRLKDAIRLERMQDVEYVSAQGRVFAFAESEGAEAFSVAAPSKLDGRGVTMCVMDTGVSPHSDLSIPRERIVHFCDMIDGRTEPYDDNGHGTFVAGVAAGNGLMSAGAVSGVAPSANIVGLKAIGKNGESGTFKILDGMQWLFDNFRQYGIRVVCMSFGAEPQTYADPLKLGAEMLSRSGLIVVAASGNSGVNSVKSPAISPEIIAVGAVDSKNAVASFTSRGSYNGIARPDLYSDGVNVRGLRAGGSYSTMSGTSAAAPYVAGACCLLCQKYKNITPRQAKAALIASASTVNGVKILRL